MYAVVDIGGKQYRVEKDCSILVEKIKGKKVGDEIELPNVLCFSDEGKFLCGTEAKDKVKVKGKIEEEVKGKKLQFVKYRRRESFQKKKGHRQNYFKVVITDIKAV